MSSTQLEVAVPRRIDEYRHIYPGQSSPQKAILYLDCQTGAFGVTYNRSIELTVLPEEVYHNRVLWFYFSPDWRLRQVRALIKAATPHAREILAGYSERMDQTDWRWRGCFDASATSARRAIAALIREEETQQGLAEATKQLG